MITKIALLGNYATQFLKVAIQKSAKKMALEIEIYEGEYDQTDMEIINEHAELYKFQPDYIFIHESIIAAQDLYYSLPETRQSYFAEDYISHLEMITTNISTRLPKAKIIYPTLELQHDNVFGNYYAKVNTSFGYQINKLNWLITDHSHKNNNFFLIDSNQLFMAAAPKREWQLIVNADWHFNPDFTNALADSFINLIKVANGHFKKCLILDLDNTLWGGIIGDDGIENIEIGTLGIGKAFTKFQKWIKALKNRGIILAVCSKNTAHIAKEPFEKHPEMELRLEDIAVFVANWDNKADNIRYIKSVLNIGFDAMVFIDDNPMERQLVRENIPEITVPEIPEDPALYLPYLIEANLFETFSYSANDKDRTAQYQEEAERSMLAKSITNIDEYLASLNMKADIEPFTKTNYSRIAQLTQRSNQFNLRTIRYTEQDIERIANDKNYLTYSVKLKDKFGDYGLISLVIINLQNPQEAFIDTWIMSCRVLKRGVEHFLINKIAAELSSFVKLKGEYIETPKNGLVKNLLPELGFISIDTNKFELNISTFTPHKTYITNE